MPGQMTDAELKKETLHETEKRKINQMETAKKQTEKEVKATARPNQQPDHPRCRSYRREGQLPAC